MAPQMAEGKGWESECTVAPKPRHVGRERLFRAPLWWQLREGSWPFLMRIGLPPLIALISLVMAAVTGKMQSLWGVVGAAGVAAAEFISFALRRPLPEARTVTPCSWIALGDAYIRLGMSIFRPRILFEQIVSVDRGLLTGGRWEPAPHGPRIRVRFVMRGSWTLASIAYPLSMDPLGELTTHMRLAASRNQERLRFAEDAPDETITAAYGRVEAAYRAWVGTSETSAPTPAPALPQWPANSASPPGQAYSP